MINKFLLEKLMNLSRSIGFFEARLESYALTKAERAHYQHLRSEALSERRKTKHQIEKEL